MSANLHVLILAGGSGERFWPYSRRARPKQLLKLFSDRTMLEETIARLGDVVPPERIFVLTNREQVSAVRAACSALPAENIVAEPAKRDTAPAVALGVGLILRRDPEAVMAVLPADHLIKDAAAFRRDLLAGAKAASADGALLTIGIKPSWACPGFGYIEQGRRVSDDPAIYEVKRFREKPDAATAESFLRQGNFRWNAGMFIWSLPAIMDAFAKHAPELSAFVARMGAAQNPGALLDSDFPKLPKISVDYAIMEKAARVLELEASFDWDDVGSWLAVAKYLEDTDGNAANCPVIAQDASHNIVFSSGSGRKHVALVGVEDLIVIETGDALLVCHRRDAENIKKLVPRVPEELQ